ncbi:transcriptional regulator [Methanocella sp. CWC-04]|uniref:Transcriptional regulator n=1 Tax=Methanooceanicella nereidis TaxID=2052831 RepID=A0AAP2RBF3_9EURY|nr:nickel-dependent lactate racemase [Methanocella sp. CWC-04]MCD1294233.1 transcriptional regulator [Methanocella sp. CWC-04]
MAIIELKYGKGHFHVEVPDKNLVKVITPEELGGVKNELAEIKNALENPIGSSRLREKLKPGMKVAVIISDVTRPCPSYKFLPAVLDEINAGGVQDKDITVIVALGSHRKCTPEEHKALMGDAYGRVRCIDHDKNDCRYIGTSTFGHRIEIFGELLDADVVVCTGNIEYHYFAGYSGGVKAILPGCASHDTIQNNHEMMRDPRAETGRLDSPIREEIDQVPGMMKVDFLLDVILNSKKEIVAVVAGDPMKAHREGIKFVDNMYGVTVPKADIVITCAGGYPKDINMYQAQKAMDNAKHVVKDGGTMIMVAQCVECLGNDVFACWVDEATTIEAQARRMDEKFELGGHKASVIARTAMKCDIYLVSAIPDETVRKMFLIPAKTPEDALEAAFKKHGPDATVLVSPHGGMVLTKPE